MKAASTPSDIIVPWVEHLTIAFEQRFLDGGARELVPIIGKVSLVDLVAEYERRKRFDVAGGYAGLVLAANEPGDISRYLLGEQEPSPGSRVPLLDCKCGCAGCWPLVATRRGWGRHRPVVRVRATPPPWPRLLGVWPLRFQ